MADDDPKPDLSFVTNEQLINELMDRHVGVIIARESQVDAEGDRYAIVYEFSGGVSRAIGMVERMKKHLLDCEWKNPRDDA